jgi:hypothetical protein
MGLNPAIRAKLTANGFMCADNFKSVGPVELSKETGLTHLEANEVLTLINDQDAGRGRPTGSNAMDMIRKVRRGDNARGSYLMLCLLVATETSVDRKRRD